MIYIIGDIHGDNTRLCEILIQESIIDTNLDWCLKDSEFVFLGDYINRGTDSLSVINNIIKWKNQASNLNTKVICLVGNHDLIFAARVLSYKDTSLSFDQKFRIEKLWYAHAKTNLSLAETVFQKYFSVFNQFLECLQFYYISNKKLFIHADSFEYLEYIIDYVSLQDFTKLTALNFYNFASLMCDERLFNKCTQQIFDINLEKYKCDVVYHGHTPHYNTFPLYTYNQKAVNCDGSLSGYYNQNKDRGFILKC